MNIIAPSASARGAKTMNREHCPVCKTVADTGHPGDSLQVHCPRCGPYVISGTAVAMLHSRLDTSPRAAARASHAIRSRTSEDKWFEIDSTNVDEIVSQPLPAPEHQLVALMEHLRRRTGDAHFSPIELGDLETLTAIAGAVDSSALMRLVQWAIQEGLLQTENDGKAFVLTPKAWSAQTGALESKDKALDVVKMTENGVKLTRGQCPTCGPNRRAEIKASHAERYDDDDSMVWAKDTYNVLKCGGCDTVYIQHEHLFSEDIEYRQMADGEWEQVAIPCVTYWPAPAKRDRPEWLEDLEDDALRTVFGEVYGALDSDHRILAAIGARTTLDRAMVLLGATADSFSGKLCELEDKGIVSAHEKENLLVLTDAGNASAHRAWRPTPKNLGTVMSGVESFLHRTLIFGKEISAVRKEIPTRPKPSKGGRSG